MKDKISKKITKIDKNILTPDLIKICSQKFNENDKFLLAKNAISNGKFGPISLERKNVQEMNHIFSNTIKTVPDITDQESSGRCWLFAFLNTMRIPMINKHHLKDDFEFSQVYLYFWDKFEKCYFFLQNMIELRDQNLDSPYVRFLLKEPQEDGGDWYMFIDLVEKYGLVPKNTMMESYQSDRSSKLVTVLNRRLRDYANVIREFGKDYPPHKIESFLKDCMIEIYRVLVIFLGEPPEKFIWERYQSKQKSKKSKKLKNSKKSNNLKNSKSKLIKKIQKSEQTESKKLKNKQTMKSINKNKKQRGGNDDIYVSEHKHITPLEFYKKYVPVKLDRMVSLIHAPSGDKKMWTKYNLRYIGNMYGGREAELVNVPIEYLMNAAKKSIDKGRSVWFGGDVDYDINSQSGILDPDSYNHSLIFDFNSDGLDKANRLQYYSTEPNHAMVINGYNLDRDKKINRWKVENSWGEDVGQKGYYTMTQKWFSEHLFQIVVDRDCLDSQVKKVLSSKPVVLEPWDPFGTLAI